MATKKSPLEKLQDTLEKKGLNPITTLNDDSIQSKVTDFLDTGNLALNVVLGGGWPLGRVVEVFGHEASGKSMLAALACAKGQKRQWVTTYLDNEYAIDEHFFTSLGIDPNLLYRSSADRFKDVFEMLEAMIDFKNEQFGPGTPMIFVWDSVAATTTKEELERNYEDKGYATGPIYLSAAFRKLTHIFSQERILFFCTNQIRSNVGVQYGDKYTTFGGWPMKFYSSIRLNLDEESVEKIGEKGERKRVIGMNIRAQCVKNKITTPYRECLLPMSFIDNSINEAESVLTMLKELGLVIVNPGGNYKMTVPGLGEIGFKRGDMPELVADYRPELYDFLVQGWKRLPGKKEDNGDG